MKSYIEKCLDFLDELNSEANSVFNEDLFNDLCNARIELKHLLENQSKDVAKINFKR